MSWTLAARRRIHTSLPATKEQQVAAARPRTAVEKKACDRGRVAPDWPPSRDEPAQSAGSTPDLLSALLLDTAGYAGLANGRPALWS